MILNIRHIIFRITGMAGDYQEKLSSVASVGINMLSFCLFRSPCTVTLTDRRELYLLATQDGRYEDFRVLSVDDDVSLRK